MNRYERAVIAAARNDCDLSPGLTAAVAALDEYESINSLDRLMAWLEKNGETGITAQRAHFSLRRQVQYSGAGWSTGWHDKITTAEQFAELEPWEVAGVRNAGPVTLAIWAAGLRAVGVEPAWARELNV